MNHPRSQIRPTNNTKPYPHKIHKKNYNNYDNVKVGEKEYNHAVEARNKYLGLAKGEDVAGDIVAAQRLYQYAEHYSRIISEAQASTPSKDNIPAEETKEVLKKKIPYFKRKIPLAKNDAENAQSSQ